MPVRWKKQGCDRCDGSGVEEDRHSGKESWCECCGGTGTWYVSDTDFIYATWLRDEPINRVEGKFKEMENMGYEDYINVG